MGGVELSFLALAKVEPASACGCGLVKAALPHRQPPPGPVALCHEGPSHVHWDSRDNQASTAASSSQAKAMLAGVVRGETQGLGLLHSSCRQEGRTDNQAWLGFWQIICLAEAATVTRGRPEPEFQCPFPIYAHLSIPPGENRHHTRREAGCHVGQLRGQDGILGLVMMGEREVVNGLGGRKLEGSGWV